MQAPQLSREERIDRLWRLGRLRWKLYHDQQEVYDAIRGFLDDPGARYEQFYVDICRQYGKTFTGVLVAVECALRNPDWRILYTAATRTGLWQFVQPNIDAVLADCPADLRPTWSQLDASYHFANGSQIHLAGVNNGHENDARGPKAHLVINEEAGFVDRLDYLVKSIELPMLTTTGGRIVFITTPAETPAHESTSYKSRCRAKGRYIKRTLDDNHHLSDVAKSKLIEEAGGRESTQCRRELYCEDVVDETRAAIPEWLGHRERIVVPVKLPDYYHPLVAMDVGFRPDPTHVLFGCWDFLRAKLLVKAEFYDHNALTSTIADGVKFTESVLWPWLEQEDAKHPDGRYKFEPWRKERRRIFRYSDTEPRLIGDLAAMHDMAFTATQKDQKEAQVNELRMLVRDEKIEIDPACEQLIVSLETTIWNRQRTEWERTPLGHGDGVDALLYMLRNAPRYLNPYPTLRSLTNPLTHQVNPNLEEPARTPLAHALSQLYGRA